MYVPSRYCAELRIVPLKEPSAFCLKPRKMGIESRLVGSLDLGSATGFCSFTAAPMMLEVLERRTGAAFVVAGVVGPVPSFTAPPETGLLFTDARAGGGAVFEGTEKNENGVGFGVGGAGAEILDFFCSSFSWKEGF